MTFDCRSGGHRRTHEMGTSTCTLTPFE
ncbi:MAG: hypothetical protein QOH33_625, partial [Paraburkholderia sp.]|nr:hypothetical protein [Paraburkholderia sp.]